MPLRRALLCSLLAASACHGGSHDAHDLAQPTAATPLQKGDGLPASFACNHHFTDGPSQGISNESITIAAQQNFSGPARGAILSLIDPATAAPLSGPFTADQNGHVSVSVVANTRIAWQTIDTTSTNGSACDDACLPSYEFNRLTLPAAQAADGTMASEIFEIDHYFGVYAVAGEGADVGAGLLIGTVRDCDGDPVANAQVQLSGALRCADASHAYPCIIYLDENGTPSPTGVGTGTTGQFAVMNVPVGTATIAVLGVIDGGGTSAEAMGSLSMLSFAKSVSFGTSAPLED